jgi:hypothetical protein
MKTRDVKSFLGDILELFLVSSREYWRIYNGPGFLAVVWFGSFPTLPRPLPLPFSSVSKAKLSLFLSLSAGRRGSLLTAMSYDDKKAGYSINYSILSGEESSVSKEVVNDVHSDLLSFRAFYPHFYSPRSHPYIIIFELMSSSSHLAMPKK